MAKFLEKAFLEQREKGEEENASLLQICRGTTQTESARRFYETLDVTSGFSVRFNFVGFIGFQVLETLLIDLRWALTCSR